MCRPTISSLLYILYSLDQCIFGDQPGVIEETGLTCEELLGAPSNAYRCYTYDKQCCHSCSWYRRQESVARQICHYGDKKEQCSETECDSDLCCETCAIHSGKLKSNLYSSSIRHLVLHILDL